MNKLLLAIITLFIISCGIKGPPLPPVSETTIQKQRTIEEEKNEKTNQNKVKPSGQSDIERS